MLSAQDDGLWAPVEDALDRAARDGRTIEIWLRDDDAVAVTPALDRLAALARRFDLPVLLAVIPAPAEAGLAAFVADQPLLTPTQHGYAHANHAAPGERACELGGARALATTLDELTRGRARMDRLFGPAGHADVLVPPWNRIAPAVLPHLPGLGFAALSTFGDAHSGARGLRIVNADLDIVDWRGDRRCRPVTRLVAHLAELLGRAGPTGILTHHLVHDNAAWAFLDEALARLHRRANVRFAPAWRAPSLSGCRAPSVI